MDKVIVFRLVNGEEVLAKFADPTEENGAFNVIQPIRLVIDNEGSLHFAPGLFFGVNGPEPVKLQKTAIIYYGEAQEEIAAKYIQATTGLIVPTEKKIIMG